MYSLPASFCLLTTGMCEGHEHLERREDVLGLPGVQNKFDFSECKHVVDRIRMTVEQRQSGHDRIFH